MLGQLGLEQGPIATEVKLAAGIDFVPQEAIDPKHGIPREPEPQHKDVDGLERGVKLIVYMLTPIEGLDPLEKTGLGIKPVDEERGEPADPRPGDETGIDLKKLGNILEAQLVVNRP